MQSIDSKDTSDQTSIVLNPLKTPSALLLIVKGFILLIIVPIFQFFILLGLTSSYLSPSGGSSLNPLESVGSALETIGSNYLSLIILIIYLIYLISFLGYPAGIVIILIGILKIFNNIYLLELFNMVNPIIKINESIKYYAYYTKKEIKKDEILKNQILSIFFEKDSLWIYKKVDNNTTTSSIKKSDNIDYGNITIIHGREYFKEGEFKNFVQELEIYWNISINQVKEETLGKFMKDARHAKDANQGKTLGIIATDIKTIPADESIEKFQCHDCDIELSGEGKYCPSCGIFCGEGIDVEIEECPHIKISDYDFCQRCGDLLDGTDFSNNEKSKSLYYVPAIPAESADVIQAKENRRKEKQKHIQSAFGKKKTNSKK